MRRAPYMRQSWLQGSDLHRRSQGYEPCEMLLLYPAKYGVPASGARRRMGFRPVVLAADNGLAGAADSDDPAACRTSPV